MNTQKQCLRCGSSFTKPCWNSKKVWKKRLYCSTRCAGLAWIGHAPPKSAFKKGSIPWNKDKHINLNDCLKKWRENGGGIGITHPNWKGENAKRAAIHMWVKFHKGRPDKCPNCGKITRWIHWANIDHKYRRNLDDYIPLCPSCHKKHDLVKGIAAH